MFFVALYVLLSVVVIVYSVVPGTSKYALTLSAFPAVSNMVLRLLSLVAAFVIISNAAFAESLSIFSYQFVFQIIASIHAIAFVCLAWSLLIFCIAWKYA